MGIFGKSKFNRSAQPAYMTPAGVEPRCPHCNKELNGVYTQEVKNEFGKTWLYFCTHCAKVLGVSQRKGFWMG